MRKILLLVFPAVFCLALSSLFGEEFTYVGAGRCKLCHQAKKLGAQYTIWQSGPHARAFTVLTTEKGLAEGKKSQLEGLPEETPRCLKCHSPLFEQAPKLKSEGVTCEVCHGPGSDYKKINIMKNRAEAAKKGLFIYGSPEDIKKKCASCHQSTAESEFDFAAAWEKIKHPLPRKKQVKL